MNAGPSLGTAADVWGAKESSAKIDSLDRKQSSVVNVAVTQSSVSPDSIVIKNLKDPREVEKGETKYILQDRYLEKGRRFSTWLFDRMDVGMTSGYVQLAERGDHTVHGGVPIGVYLKYNINRLSAWRLGYGYTTFDVDGFGTKYGTLAVRDHTTLMKQHSLDADFMYNLSSYLYGHNAKRVLSASAVVGVGYINTSLTGERRNVLKGQLGLNFDFKLTPSSHLFVEPYVALASDQVDFSGETNAHRWDVMYGVKAGVGVNFNSRNADLADVNYNGNVFWELSQGVTFFPSEDVELAKSLGTSYRLSVGKWLDPYVGMRLSGCYTDFTSAVRRTAPRDYMGFRVIPSHESNLRTVLVGGRLELMVDVLNFFPAYRSRRNPLFSWQVSAGGEFGYLMKHVMEQRSSAREAQRRTMQTYYAGVVAGTQLLVRPDANTAVFVEPQVLLANYSVPYTNAPDYRAKYTDEVGMVNVGVRLSRPVKAERGQGGDAETGAGPFVPYNFAGLVAGGLRDEHSSSWHADDKAQLSGGVCVGRAFASWFSAKLQVEYQQVSAPMRYSYGVDGGVVYGVPTMFNEDFMLINGKVAAMLNASSLYQGYDPRRRLNFFVEGGPAYVYVLKKEQSLYSQEMAGGENPTPVVGDTSDKSGTFGVFGGVVADMRAWKNLHVHLEPYVQLLLKSRIFVGASSKASQDVFMGVNLGVTYRF